MHVESPKYLLTNTVYCKESLQLEERKKEKQVAHYLGVLYCTKSHKKRLSTLCSSLQNNTCN